MNCKDCDAVMAVDGSGQPYCRACLVERAIEQGECRKGHRRNLGNIVVDDRKRVCVRCRDCNKASTERYRQRNGREPRPPADRICGTCGGPRRLNSAGRVYCPACTRVWAAKKPKTTHCPSGHEKTPDNVLIWFENGREVRTCKKCRQLRSDEAKAARKARSRRQQEWFDWVVVDRVVKDGSVGPGRQLSEAEWFGVFDRIGPHALSASELGRRGHATNRTVERMRKAYEERKVSA